MSAPGPKPASTSCCGIRTFATASCFETAALRPLQGEVLNPHGPHGEERGNAANLEPCSHGLRCDHHSIQRKTAMESNLPSPGATGTDPLAPVAPAEAQSALGPAVRDRICSAQCWPTRRPTC